MALLWRKRRGRERRERREERERREREEREERRERESVRTIKILPEAVAAKPAGGRPPNTQTRTHALRRRRRGSIGFGASCVCVGRRERERLSLCLCPPRLDGCCFWGRRRRRWRIPPNPFYASKAPSLLSLSPDENDDSIFQTLSERPPTDRPRPSKRRKERKRGVGLGPAGFPNGTFLFSPLFQS